MVLLKREKSVKKILRERTCTVFTEKNVCTSGPTQCKPTLFKVDCNCFLSLCKYLAQCLVCIKCSVCVG